MNPYSGDVYEMREELLGDATVGARIDMDYYRKQLQEIVEPTRDEQLAAAEADLVRVTQEVAQKIALGNREQRRRRGRRKR